MKLLKAIWFGLLLVIAYAGDYLNDTAPAELKEGEFAKQE